MSFIEDDEAFGVFAQNQHQTDGLPMEDMVEDMEAQQEGEATAQDYSKRLDNGKIIVMIQSWTSNTRPRRSKPTTSLTTLRSRSSKKRSDAYMKSSDRRDGSLHREMCDHQLESTSSLSILSRRRPLNASRMERVFL